MIDFRAIHAERKARETGDVFKQATQAFAVPGEESLIDMVHPDTGRSIIEGETLEQIRVRYPGAELVSFDEWMVAKAARQHTPITWLACTEERYREMLNVLPPAVMEGGGFMVGEPVDHDASNGSPRFQAFRQVGASFQYASRPMTIREFRGGRP